jgi:hypothetical protein
MTNFISETLKHISDKTYEIVLYLIGSLTQMYCKIIWNESVEHIKT